MNEKEILDIKDDLLIILESLSQNYQLFNNKKSHYGNENSTLLSEILFYAWM